METAQQPKTDVTMYKLTARNLPAPRYFSSYSAAVAHARALGLSKGRYQITQA